MAASIGARSVGALRQFTRHLTSVQGSKALVITNNDSGVTRRFSMSYPICQRAWPRRKQRTEKNDHITATADLEIPKKSTPGVHYGENPDALYKKIYIEFKAHDQAVVESYETFCCLAADGLELSYKNEHLPRVIERWTVQKSPHIYKKHRVQYEARTHFRAIELYNLTGSTADTYLEYIQRNLPEGMAMKVERHRIEQLPGFVRQAIKKEIEGGTNPAISGNVLTYQKMVERKRSVKSKLKEEMTGILAPFDFKKDTKTSRKDFDDDTLKYRQVLDASLDGDKEDVNKDEVDDENIEDIETLQDKVDDENIEDIETLTDDCDKDVVDDDVNIIEDEAADIDADDTDLDDGNVSSDSDGESSDSDGESSDSDGESSDEESTSDMKNSEEENASDKNLVDK